MNSKKRAFCIFTLIIILTGCGGNISAQPTATPTPTVPSTIPGIDEPVFAEFDIRDFKGNTTTEELKIQISDAHIETLENEQSYVLLMVRLLDCPFKGTPKSFPLVCGNVANEYLEENGILQKYNQGQCESNLVLYKVAADIEFRDCALHLPDDQIIPLHPFFK